jgi:hypothetical protein
MRRRRLCWKTSTTISYLHSFDNNSPAVKEANENIDKLEHMIHHLEERYRKSGSTFAGIAFVSFQSEDMKEHVLRDNKHTWMERILTLFNRGQTPGVKEHDLQWRG